MEHVGLERILKFKDVIVDTDKWCAFAFISGLMEVSIASTFQDYTH